MFDAARMPPFNVPLRRRHRNSSLGKHLTFALCDYERDGYYPGVDWLLANKDLTINNQTVSPTFCYIGGDANSSDWSPYKHGETLTLQAGTAPSYNQGSPGHGTNDDSVKFNSGGQYMASSSSFGDLGTDDFVWELVLKLPDTNAGTEFWMSKYVGPAPYWIIGRVADNAHVHVWLVGDMSAASVISGTLAASTWYHVMLFGDRSGYAQIFVNGVTSGSAVDVSGLGNFASDYNMHIGGGRSTIAYCSLWSRPDWLDTHLQSDLAAERALRWQGVYPQRAKGTAVPTVKTRSTSAYMYKIESGQAKLHKVGAEHLRVCQGYDPAAAEFVYGYLAEPQRTNRVTYSEAIAAHWTKVDAGDAVASDAVECPDGRTVADSLAADTDVGQHGMSTSVTLVSDTTHTFSMFVKAGSAEYNDVIKLEDTTTGCYAYFKLSTVEVLEQSSCAGYIVGPYGHDFYLCIIVYTATSGAKTVRWLVGDDFEVISDSIAGDDAVNFYVWGAQMEEDKYPTTPIVTDGAIATRNADPLEFVAGANIGGEDRGKVTVECDVLLPVVSDGGQRCVVDIADSGSDYIQCAVAGYGRGELTIRSSGGTDGDAGAAEDVSDGESHSLSFRCQANRADVSCDAVSGDVDTTCDIPDALDRLCIGVDLDGAQQFCGLISRLRVYKKFVPSHTTSESWRLLPLSTTDTGSLQFITRGPAGTGMWVDWGDGNSEWIQHTGTGNDITTTHDYGGVAGTKDIAFVGALHHVTQFQCIDPTLSGDISNLSGMTSLTALVLYNSAVSGDISNLSGMTSLAYLYLNTTSVDTYGTTSLPAWADCNIQIHDLGLDQTEVDDFLIDLAAAGGTNGPLNIAGTNDARSSASDAAKATLLGNGWALTVNE